MDTSDLSISNRIWGVDQDLMHYRELQQSLVIAYQDMPRKLSQVCKKVRSSGTNSVPNKGPHESTYSCGSTTNRGPCCYLCQMLQTMEDKLREDGDKCGQYLSVRTVYNNFSFIPSTAKVSSLPLLRARLRWILGI